MRLGKLSITGAFAAMLVAIVPSLAHARNYRFRADVSVYQTVRWNLEYRDLSCGDDSGDYYLYKGSGGGTLRVSGRRLYITFSTSRLPGLSSSELRVPGTVFATGNWSSARQDDPNKDCDPTYISSPLGPGLCGQTRRGVARARLSVYPGSRPFFGRTAMIGVFDGRGANDMPCADPSLLTGALGYGGSSMQRQAEALIRTSRIGSSILLSASRRKTLRVGDLVTPGAATRAIRGGGSYTARWSVRLTRI